jgi:DNA-binding response OmpR family regulator
MRIKKMMSAKKILIVEDDKDISELIKLYLFKEGYICFQNYTGQGILETIVKESIDLIILDIMLPFSNGIEIAKEIRKEYSVPIIFVTAKQEDEDKIVGLQIGGDDYVTKPFNPRELTERINSIFRRLENKYREIGSRNLSLDLDKKLVKINGKEIALAHKEFKLLSILISNPNRVFSREQLIERVYIDSGEEVFDRAIDVLVSRLRKEISDEKGETIKTVRGLGYKFVNEEDEDKV